MLIKELKSLGNAFNVLVIVPPEKLQKYVNSFLRFLTSQNKHGVYISLNKPYVSIKKEFEKDKINMERITFVDCITASVSKPAPKESVLFIKSPGDLTGLSFTIRKAINSTKSNKFLVMDALRTLLIYSSSNTVASFVRNITGKSVSSKLKTFIFTTKKQEDLFEKIAPFFDKIMEGE